MPSSSQPHKSLQKQSQPRTYRLSIRSLLALPFRICNPPPAVGKVRSCSVTPVFNVRLEDVLDRRHLPPLGLKDFEEWLLYVELSPENLYFTLWLREYTVRYRQWSKSYRHETRHLGADWTPQSSSQLAMFYARAKQTFLTPRSNYELDLPADMLAPFHVSNSSPHPDPAMFDQIAIETRKRLKESLQRFVSAQFNNVGNNRVVCGLIAGTFCTLVGALLPMIYNLSTGHSRWLRLTALPGLWLGIALLISSLNGVCLGIYIFGDLRQLRKFEMTRPPISKPKLLHISRPRSMSGLPTTTSSANSAFPHTRAPLSPPPLAHIDTGRRGSRLSSGTLSSPNTSCSDLSLSGSDGVIHISSAYYDPNPIEGPATSPATSEPGVFVFPANKPKSGFDDEDDEDDSFGITADFIHSYQDSDDGSSSNELPLSEERQRVSPFDFDGLPPPPNRDVRSTSQNPYISHPKQQLPKHSNAPPHTFISNAFHPTPSLELIEPEPEPHDKEMSFTGFLRRLQSRCNINKWLVIASSTSSVDLNEKSTDERHRNHSVNEAEKAEHGEDYDSNFPRPHPSLLQSQSQKQARDPKQIPVRRGPNVQRQFKMVKAVPAFSSPLTKVLSPVVVRGQWEIVMHSMLIACLVSWVIIGCLLAVPVPNVHGS
ncbi:hypothetical protein K435DRAFT_790394 [Dendrothele bispora CBS 962.96]|uniref:RGS domain-containing protein n=1 Tax=Dendrothele bispora (strain CBS 962.96) TaxID=1314807 RepID=A0A4V4HI63_DENBC|nr:hypothetical protein K435DRAFT_790394 [Dendrothele bispora CBS 962.96]